MKQDSSLIPEPQKEIAERHAAFMLMEQWVKDNVEALASVLLDLIPFICGECGRSALKDHLNTVNITFASIALNVIKQRNESEAAGDKCTPLCLPADATEMDDALYNLSRFLKKFNSLGLLLESNEEMPAFRMAISMFDEVDSV